MRKQRRYSQLPDITHIDMTNLIDVAFTLLIVFMITIPLVEYNVNVSPPEMNAQSIEDKNSIYVNLNSKNQVFFQDQPVSRDELQMKVDEAVTSKPTSTVFLRADGVCSYNQVMDVMKIIKTSGAKNISLITLKED
jgi:biopolymer transport protein ExbD